jgi:carbamoyl-phosphate synthase large subunit
LNLLFTSAGRRVELLRAFKDAYRELGMTGTVVAVDIDPLAPALQLADRYYLIPRITDPGYIPALVEICRRDDIDLLVPLVDRDLPYLVERRSEIEATGTRALVPTEDAAAIVSDKWLTYEFLTRLGLPTPRSWRAEEAATADLDYPVFIKPRFGSAGEGTFKVRTPRELEFFLDYVDRPIVQEYLPGPEITSDVLCDLTGNVRAVVSRKRIEVRTGEVSKGVTVREPEIIEGCAAVAKGLDATGPITVQCMMRDEHVYFTEVNYRFGGGVPLAIAAGAPYPKWLLELAAHPSIELPQIGSYKTGIYLTRYDESLIISKEERDAVQRHHL